jgi:hypothetical protein
MIRGLYTLRCDRCGKPFGTLRLRGHEPETDYEGMRTHAADLGWQCHGPGKDTCKGCIKAAEKVGIVLP